MQAMAVVLRDRGWMDLDDIARELAERDLYRRPKDDQPPPSYQLGMRARNYPIGSTHVALATRRLASPRAARARPSQVP